MWASDGLSGFTMLRRGTSGWLGLLLASVLFISCSGLGIGSGPSTSATPTQISLARLHWCGKVLMIFRDEGSTAGASTAVGTPTAAAGGTPTATATAATPTTLTNWQQVKDELGFTVYLPTTLPVGTCLVSAYGMVHDPILGGSFTIGYLLPDHSAVTFSEAPLSAQNKDAQFQCNVTTAVDTAAMNAGAQQKGTPVTKTGKAALPLQVCTGVHATTSIVFSARGTTAALQQFFNALQPDVNWVPAAS